jgi:hypothetical protein
MLWKRRGEGGRRRRGKRVSARFSSIELGDRRGLLWEKCRGDEHPDALLEVAALLLDLFDDLPDGLGKLENGELVGVADVDRSGLVRVHEEDETVDEVVDVLWND